EFEPLLQPPVVAHGSYSWSEVTTQWDHFRRIFIAPFFSGLAGLRRIHHLPVELFNYESEETQKADSFLKIRELTDCISGSIQRQRHDDSSQYLRSFREVISNTMVAADGEMRDKAGELARLSIELKARLDVLLRGS